MESTTRTARSVRPPLENAYRSWRAIAEHFGVTVRTVQLWETERGLPVHRLPGAKGRVYAYPDELNAWTSAPPREIAPPAPAKIQFRHRRGWGVALAIAMATVAMTALMAWRMLPRTQPLSFEVQGRTLAVTGTDGELLWKHDFPRPIQKSWLQGSQDQPDLRTIPLILDLDGDGAMEVVASYRSEPLGRGPSELYCFEADGRIRWRYTPGREISTVREKYSRQYDIRMVIAAPRSGGNPPLLIVVSSHRTSFPAQVAALSPNGEVLREYWHSGHIIETEEAADLERDGRTELYLAGVHAPTRSAEIIVLDPGKFGGASIETDPAFQLIDKGTADEVARIRLPSSLLGQQLDATPSPVEIRARDNGVIVATFAQAPASIPPNPPPAVEYYFGPALKQLKVEFAPSFKFAYEHLVNLRKTLSYDIEADRERLKRVEIVTPWRAASKPR